MDRKNLRKVLIFAIKEEAYFHQWFVDPESEVLYAVIESEIGLVKLINHKGIKFIS